MPNKKMYTGLDANGNKVTGLPAPTETSDAATKAYVDANAGGTVNSVNDVLPNASGDVQLIASDVFAAPASHVTQTMGAHEATAISYSNGAVSGVSFPTTPNATPNDVQKAIENLFTYANSGKTQIANAIGSPATSTDTFAKLATDITNLKNKTYGVSRTVKFDETIAADEAIESYYREFSPLKVANPTAPTGSPTIAYAVDWSKNNYIAVATNVAPMLALYKFDGTSTFTKLADATGGNPASASNALAFTSDALYLAVANNNSTTPLVVYKRFDDAFVKLATNPPQPTTASWAAAWSPDDRYLAIGVNSTIFLELYYRTGDTFEKITANVNLQPPARVEGISFSPDGTYMACAHTTTPYVTIYKKNGAGNTATYTRLTDPATLPTGNALDCKFSPDGTLLAVAHGSSPYVTIYSRSGDVFSKISDIPDPGQNARALAWSPEGKYLGVGLALGTYHALYKRTGATTFEKQGDPATLPTGAAQGFVFSSDQNHYIISHTSSPLFSIYKNNSTTQLFTKIDPQGTETMNPYTKVVGIAKEAGTAGQSKQASILIGGGLV